MGDFLFFDSLIFVHSFNCSPFRPFLHPTTDTATTTRNHPDSTTSHILTKRTKTAPNCFRILIEKMQQLKSMYNPRENGNYPPRK